MEWTQLVVGLIGGGLGGTILGRVWDNGREDRFRYADLKREVAARFLVALSDLDQMSREHRDSVVKFEEKLNGQPTEEERREMLVEVDAARQATNALRQRFFHLGAEIDLLFGVDTVTAARDLNEAWANAYDNERRLNDDDATLAARKRFIVKARKELGISGKVASADLH